MRNGLKICASFIAVLITVSGCSGKKTPVSLENAGAMTEEQLKQDLAGFSREEIVDVWGEGEASLFGMFGDVYQLDEEKTLTLYYESDGEAVQDAKFGETVRTFEGTIEEVHGTIAWVAVDEGFPIYNSGSMVSVALDGDASAAQAEDRVRVSYSGAVMETYPLQLEKQISIELLAKEEYGQVPTVMVDGCLYQSTGKTSDVDGRCGVMDGKIETSVDGTELPSENGQSNFSSGYGYQYVGGDGLDVYMPYGNPGEWKWMRFEKISPESMQGEPSVVKTYEMSDGTWRTDAQAYQYRFVGELNRSANLYLCV